MKNPFSRSVKEAAALIPQTLEAQYGERYASLYLSAFSVALNAGYSNTSCHLFADWYAAMDSPTASEWDEITEGFANWERKQAEIK